MALTLSVAWITMNVEMEIFFFWYSNLIDWAGETQLSIQSRMTLRSWMKLLWGNILFLNVSGVTHALLEQKPLLRGNERQDS